MARTIHTHTNESMCNCEIWIGSVYCTNVNFLFCYCAIVMQGSNIRGREVKVHQIPLYISWQLLLYKSFFFDLAINMQNLSLPIHFTFIHTFQFMSIVSKYEKYYVMAYFILILHSLTLHWELKISHGRSIYTMETGKHYKTGLDL